MVKDDDPEASKSGEHHLILIDEEGNKMQLNGVSSGHWGEGSRGTSTILMEGCKNLLDSCGINQEQLRTLISESPSFTIA